MHALLILIILAGDAAAAAPPNVQCGPNGCTLSAAGGGWSGFFHALQQAAPKPAASQPASPAPPAPPPPDPLVQALQAARAADNILSVKQEASDTAAAAAKAAQDADDQAWVGFYSLLEQAGKALPPQPAKPPAAKPVEPPPPAAVAPPPPPRVKLIVVSASSECDCCTQMKPVWAQVRADGFDVQIVDVGPRTSADQTLLSHYNVQTVPTAIVQRGGNEVSRLTGAFSAAAIESILKSQ